MHSFFSRRAVESSRAKAILAGKKDEAQMQAHLQYRYLSGALASEHDYGLNHSFGFDGLHR
jgi:hypothetical protein